eukprot:1148682-Pelagomonas_calceolata.AAC.5
MNGGFAAAAGLYCTGSCTRHITVQRPSGSADAEQLPCVTPGRPRKLPASGWGWGGGKAPVQKRPISRHKSVRPMPSNSKIGLAAASCVLPDSLTWQLLRFLWCACLEADRRMLKVGLTA